MRVTVPITITDAMLANSNVDEPTAGEVVYNVGHTYGDGDQVISLTTHKIYESLQASNTGHPLPVLPVTATDWWAEAGTDNRWAMFDLVRNTQTIATDTSVSAIAIHIFPGQRVNTVAVLGMEATFVAIDVYDGATQVYHYEKDLIIRQVLDHYMYAYEPFETDPSAIIFDAPPFTNAQIVVTIIGSATLPKCGSIVLGTYAYIGGTQYNAQSDAQNFSKITRDDFGTATLIPRRSIPLTSQTLTVDKSKIRRIYDIRTALNAIPALWTAIDDTTSEFFEPLAILGIYKRFKINADGPTWATIDLDLEEI